MQNPRAEHSDQPVAGVNQFPVFMSIGGVWRLSLASPADLRHLLDTDEALWAASSAPIEGLEFDAATLAFLDVDGDRRIRYEELREAVRWFLDVLKQPPAVDEQVLELSLDELNTATATGRELHAAALRILKNTGRRNQKILNLSDVVDRKKVLAAAGSNGDGVITPASVADDERLVKVVEAILATVGGVPDLSGQDGVDAEKVKLFYRELRAFIEWLDQGWRPDTSCTPNLSVFDADTLPAALSAWKAVRDNLEGYFTMCVMARYDRRVAGAVNLRDAEWSGLNSRSLEDVRALFTDAPPAPVTEAAILDFEGPLNPVHAPRLEIFRQKVWRVLFPGNDKTVGSEDWRKIQPLFGDYEKRCDGKRGGAIEKLGVARIRGLLADDAQADLLARIVKDAAAASEIGAIAMVEKLLRFKQNLLAFANNYIAFPDFYDFNRKAVFETGTLVMDCRRFTLCVHVDNPAEHAAIAARSGMYLLYCDLSRRDVPDKRRIAVAVTAGGTGALYVGKRGVFYDRKSREWDARVTAVVENPISLSEAVWAPFKRLGNIISSQIEKLTTSREKSIEKEFDAGFVQMARAVDAGPESVPPTVAAASPAPAAKSVMGGYGGMFVGGSVAVAALGSSFAFISKTFSEIGRINFLYTAVAILLIILLPTTILAILRLRARDIGKILEACGWAINGRMRLSLHLARILSYSPAFPPGSQFSRIVQLNAPGWMDLQRRPSRRRLGLLLILLTLTIVFCCLVR